jgi:hypothetical protein
MNAPEVLLCVNFLAFITNCTCNTSCVSLAIRRQRSAGRWHCWWQDCSNWSSVYSMVTLFLAYRGLLSRNIQNEFSTSTVLSLEDATGSQRSRLYSQLLRWNLLSILLHSFATYLFLASISAYFPHCILCRLPPHKYILTPVSQPFATA